MTDLLDQQDTLFHQVAHALDNFKKKGRKNYTPANIRQRMTSLKEVWSQCMQTHASLLKLYSKEKRDQEAYFKEGRLDTHEDIYQSTLDYMAEQLELLEPVVSPNTSVNSSFSQHDQTESSSFSLRHLPPIQLPPFSGKIEEWETFRDRFQALIIKNKSLSDFSRMHFLASSLTGRAREAIDGITITADNFSIAWQALKTRYEHKRRLIEVHVASLCNLPPVSRESSTELHALRDKAEKAISALKALNRSSEEMLSDILVYFVSQKLDSATRKAWRLKHGPREAADEEDESLPTFNELSKFISSRANALEDFSFSTGSKSNRGSKVTSATVSTTASNMKCPLCQRRHFINKCMLFVNKSPSQRRDIVKQCKRCFNCLSDKHSVTECKSKYACRACQQRHHSMLHLDSSALQANTVTVNSEQAQLSNEVSQVNALTVASTTAQPASVLLATAKIKVSSDSGREQTVRALLDQGSEVTFITERLAQSLRAQRIHTFTTISAVGGLKAGTCRHAVLIQLASRHGSGPKFTTQAFVMNSLTKYAPRRTTSDVEWKHLDQLILADDDPSGSEPIDVIIGADLFGSIILEGIRKGTAEQPIAQRSHFGWILSGPTSANQINSLHINVFHCALEHELRRFWESEELPLKPILSPNEILCEQHFCSTHSRASDGRYIVRLPFKDGPPISIGESRSAALSMLSNLNRRLNSNPDLKQEYTEFLSEYEALGHMTKVQDSSSPESQVVYLPHHPVVRASSSTTRVRVVFNASSKTTNGTTLNNHLLPGPKLQTNLFEVLLRWRIHKYVYTADIAKMYRQIWVDSRDQDYQRILWNVDNLSSPQEYRLLTVTYGTASAPFLALRVIKQLVRDEGHAFPLAIPILQKNIYVDDVLFGADDMPLLKQTREQVCALLRKGGFELRKWASNRTELLMEMPPEDHGLACHKVLQFDDKVSILGIIWQPALDAFQFKVSTPDSIPKTKRSILSMIAKLFDPLGWATPITIAAKVFMQELWRLHLDWDDLITTSTLKKWEAIYKQLLNLDGLQLPRWICLGSDTTHCELHGFADASTVAYAASVYIRVTSVAGDTNTMLLAGKSKVAPVKLVSIPRLELCAAVLLARLLDVVRSSLGLMRVPCYCWTDSTVTLAWLNQDPSKWKTFVAHRVAAVQTQVPYAKWLHVSTDHNPADCASRGIQKTDLANHSLWWQGPVWLKLQTGEWPAPVTLQSHDGHEEAKLSTSHTAQTNEPWDLSVRYSSWPKLVRVTAYIMRFIRRCRSEPISSVHLSSPSFALSAEEFKRARSFWLKFTQKDLFPNDLQRLRLNRSLQSKSPILSLHPFLDDDGLIRVGGRLQNSPLSFDMKHPILLASHPVVRLIIRHTHLRLLHAGLQLTIATLRREYWILRCRNLAKSILHECVVCTREKAAVPTQLMGQLPSARVSAPARPFLHCGVDYAGPIATRASSGRGRTSRKAYIAVFICLATRAIHLELVGNYSSSAFLDAYTRFCSRRGLPEIMYSDNGTTFAGADRELTTAYRAALRDPEFLNLTASDRVTWKFIPPHAPHFGGLWEAGVRSVKHHLRRILGAHTLTFEELTTVLCKIEACLNSRPLGPLTSSADDYESLTPGHFLIGSALTVNPEPSVLSLKENRLSRWQLVRQITERFWRIWQTDYVNTLQQRSKWLKANPSIQPGMLVLMRNSTLPPCKWQLGRVTQCHTGSDGLVRVVSVKTANSEYKRPISQLCLLPIQIEAQSQNMEPVNS